MPRRERSPVERAAGKLIVAVQREWTEDMGEPGADASEDAMHKCHTILDAARSGSLEQELCGRTIADYLGRAWVLRHPNVLPAIRDVESLLGHV
jgi:hypothetical protein